jgi:hypothetical protein
LRSGDVKVYPYLTQRNFLSPAEPSLFLDVGQSTCGVAYFEQDDSWGAFFPAPQHDKVRLTVRVQDVFGRWHRKTFDVPSVTMEGARRYNPEFGTTHAKLRGEVLPFDAAKQPSSSG